VKFKIFRQLDRWTVVDSNDRVTFHQTLSGAMDHAATQNRKADYSRTLEQSHKACDDC
jgi:hypothetical protein